MVIMENKKQRDAFTNLSNAIELSQRSNSDKAPIVATGLMACFGGLLYAGTVYSIEELSYLSLVALAGSFACAKYMYPNGNVNVNQEAMYNNFIRVGAIDKSYDKEKVCNLLNSYKSEYEALLNKINVDKISSIQSKKDKKDLMNKYIAKLGNSKQVEMCISK